MAVSGKFPERSSRKSDNAKSAAVVGRSISALFFFFYVKSSALFSLPSSSFPFIPCHIISPLLLPSYVFSRAHYLPLDHLFPILQLAFLLACWPPTMKSSFGNKLFGSRAKAVEEVVEPSTASEPAEPADEKAFPESEQQPSPAGSQIGKDEEIVKVDATPQEGVRAAQAALKVWTKPHLVVAYIL